MILLGDKSMRQLLDEDFALITLPASILLDRANDLVEAPHDPRFAIATQMEQFRARAGQSYLDIFRTFCQNRSRVRRTLCHTVQDWEVLQSEAEEADRLLQVQIDEVPLIERMPNPVPTYSLPLSSWAYFYKLKQLEWIVQLGFELDIYQQDELVGMYWYLHHVAKSRVQHVDRIKSFTMHKLNLFRSSQQQTQRQSPQRAAKEAEFSRSLSFLQSSGLEAAATCELADALYCLHLALNRLGLVKSPPRPYSTDRLRYELRMRPFLPVAPEMPGLAEYTEECLEPKIEPQDLLKRATAAVGSARKLFDVMRKLSDEDAFCVGSHDRWAERLKACLMSCIQAHVSISVLNRAMEEQAAQGSSMPKVQVVVPASGSCHHDWWIVPKITAI